MKLYEIIVKTEGALTTEAESRYVKTDAPAEAVQRSIDFLPNKDVEKLLQAIRIQGYKATEVKLEPVDVFEM